LPTQQKTTGHCNVPTSYSENASWLVGPQEAIQVAPGGKISQIALPVSRNWKAWVSNGVPRRYLERPFERLADYRKTITAMFLMSYKENAKLAGFATQRILLQVASKKESQITPAPYSVNWLV
jgi:hypothetical protein